ncbi:MAG: RadC family protein, partial [Cellulophaga sp.]
AELVAILIGSGSRDESAVELSKRILASVNNNLNQLGKLSIGQLMQFKGIGEAKAVTIAAALEMGRRRRGEEVAKIEKIGSSKDVFNLLQPILGELPHEEFWIVYLNNSNKVLHQAQLSKGGITGTLVDVRLVLKQALEIGAIGLILAHNHPSGGLNPSTADKQITQKLKTAAQALDMKVLDHIIITQREYFSFADDNLL